LIKKLKNTWIIIGTIIFVFSLTVVVFISIQNNLIDVSQDVSQKVIHNNTDTLVSPRDPLTSEQQNHSIESEKPTTITDDWQRESVTQFLEQNELHSLQNISTLGQRISFEITSEDNSWVRPVYSENWHSSFMGGKYSNITHLISYAQRNVFIYHGGLSEGAGLYYHLGFTENWGKPVGSSFNSAESFEIWSISRKVKEIIKLDDQWLVLVEPQLQGYQTLKINYKDTDIKTDQTSEPRVMIFRVITPDGYELERTVGILPVQ